MESVSTSEMFVSTCKTVLRHSQNLHSSFCINPSENAEPPLHLSIHTPTQWVMKGQLME